MTRRLSPGPLLVVLAVLLAACSASVHQTATSTTSGGVGTTTARAPVTTAPHAALAKSVSWHDCTGGFECGSYDVPLDWFHPDGKMISLALIRHPAAKPARRLGSLFLNPGGPGEPGVGFLRDILRSGDFPATLIDRFDLVSWDPRGSGASNGVDCISSEEQLRPALDPTPNNAKAANALTAQVKGDVKRCLAEDGKVIPFVGTRETAADLDALRAAVGDAKLHYLGFSYGTEIGAQYLQDFPGHAGTIVLDGVVVPGEDPIVSGHDQIASFEKNLNSFLTSCAQRASCKFGDGHPKASLQALLAKLETGVRLPAAYTSTDDSGDDHTRDGTLGIGEALSGIITALYSQDSWPYLEKALAQATDPAKPDGFLLLSFRDSLSGRNQDGTWSHLPDAFQAIGCADQPQRATTVLGDPALISKWGREMPFFGAVQATGQPGCFGWPAARYPVTMPTAADFSGVPGVLFVNSNADPATPYAQAVKMHHLVPGSRLLTWNGADHTSVGQGHPCIDDKVVAYFVDGTLPTSDSTCKS